MRLTHIHQIAGHAEDFAASRTFYRDLLGARVLGEYDPPGLLFLDFAGIRLMLEASASPTTIYFRVDDIHSAFETFKARGVVFEDEPHVIHKDDDGVFDNPATEEWMVFFRDPGGNLLALAERR